METQNPKKQKRQLPVEYLVGSAIGSAIRQARANGWMQYRDRNKEVSVYTPGSLPSVLDRQGLINSQREVYPPGAGVHRG